MSRIRDFVRGRQRERAEADDVHGEQTPDSTDEKEEYRETQLVDEPSLPQERGRFKMNLPSTSPPEPSHESQHSMWSNPATGLGPNQPRQKMDLSVLLSAATSHELSATRGIPQSLPQAGIPPGRLDTPVTSSQEQGMPRPQGPQLRCVISNTVDGGHSFQACAGGEARPGTPISLPYVSNHVTAGERGLLSHLGVSMLPGSKTSREMALQRKGDFSSSSSSSRRDASHERRGLFPFHQEPLRRVRSRSPSNSSWQRFQEAKRASAVSATTAGPMSLRRRMYMEKFTNFGQPNPRAWVESKEKEEMWRRMQQHRSDSSDAPARKRSTSRKRASASQLVSVKGATPTRACMRKRSTSRKRSASRLSSTSCHRQSKHSSSKSRKQQRR